MLASHGGPSSRLWRSRCDLARAPAHMQSRSCRLPHALLQGQSPVPRRPGRPSGYCSERSGCGAGRPSSNFRGISRARDLVEQSMAAAMKSTSNSCSCSSSCRRGSARLSQLAGIANRNEGKRYLQAGHQISRAQMRPTAQLLMRPAGRGRKVGDHCA